MPRRTQRTSAGAAFPSPTRRPSLGALSSRWWTAGEIMARCGLSRSARPGTAKSSPSSILGVGRPGESSRRGRQVGESEMAIVRKSLKQIRRMRSKADWAKVKAATEAEIRRQAIADGHPVMTARMLKEARVVAPEDVDVKAIREQRRARPDRATRILLAIIDREPATVERALRSVS